MRKRAAAFAPGFIAPVVAIRRDRPVALLDRVRRRVTVITAPAGYGKSVLVAQWVDSHPDEEVVWLTLGDDHDDHARLARCLRPVLRLVEGGASATLVLDDFHVLRDPRTVAEGVAFIEQAPESLHVILVTRGDPPSRLYRLRLSDALAEVDAQDLAFTAGEVAELAGVDDVDELTARTEGWPVGLALSKDADVEEYFAREVLAGLPPHLRQFLVSTSVLHEMNGPLCDVVTGGSRSQSALEQLEEAGAFVASLDAHHARFRSHPMLRSLLRRRLREDGGDVERVLLHRAAEWHLARGEVEEGVHYLVDAGAGDDVIEAAFTHGAALFEQHRTEEVAEWIEQARPASGEGLGRALLLEAAALQFGGHHEGVRQKLDEVVRMADPTPAERLLADLLRAYAAIEEGATTEAIDASERVLRGVAEVEDADLPDLFGLTRSAADVIAGALVAHGVASMYDGRLEGARVDLEAVGDECHGAWRTSALGGRALVEAWSGNLRAGEALATQALALADDLGLGDASRTTAWLAQALVARGRDDFDRATEFLDRVEDSGGTRRRVVGLWVATERASVAIARAASHAGRAYLGGQWASQHPSMPTAVLARRLAVDVHVFIHCGDLDAAETLLQDGLCAESADVLSARVRVAIERGDTTGARIVLRAWPQEPLPRASREWQLWTAVLEHLDGNEAGARAAMASVVAEAEAEGDLALFRTAGNSVLGPARALFRQAPTAFLRAIVEQPVTVAPARPAKGLAEQLTDREFMVLVHLPSRESNAEIAEKLGVSLNTVKTHLKHIYRKLEVVGRSEAVDVAERLHLL